MDDGDPHDWPQSEHGLRELDAALRCSICSELFNAPKLLPCGHAFCSQCIRRHGDAQLRSTGARQCPQCRMPWENAHLTICPIQCLGFACQAFRSVRPGLLENARTAAILPSGRCPVGKHAKRQRVSSTRASSAPKTAPDHEGSDTPPGREIMDVMPRPSYSQRAVLKAEHGAPASHATQESPEQPRHSQIGSDPLGPSAAVIKPPASAPKGCGFCPVCNRTFSFTFLGRHVESCLVAAADTVQPDPPATAEPPSASADFLDLTSSPGRGNSPAVASQKKRHSPAKAPNLPPKLCFTIMKDKDIRTKLREELERRYQDFRQYVASAHDRGDNASAKRLAHRFSKDMQRESNLQETASTAAEVVAGAEHGFEHLIAACTRRVQEARRLRGEPVERCQRGHLRAAALQAAHEPCAPSLPTRHGASPHLPPLLVGHSAVAHGPAAMPCTQPGGSSLAGASDAVGRESETGPSLPATIDPVVGWAGAEGDADGDAESPLATAAPRVGASWVASKWPHDLAIARLPPDSDGSHSTGAQAQAAAPEKPAGGGAGTQVAGASLPGAALS